MKNLFLALSSLLLLIFLPVAALAHTGEDTESAHPGMRMMHEIEDEALGDDLHEEMENLMVKMMNGTMSEGESTRMRELMEEHPGPGALMMNRLGLLGGAGMQAHNSRGFGGMMGGGMMTGFGGVMLFWWINQLLVWAVLILLIIALAKWIRKN